MSANKHTIKELYEMGLSDNEIADRIGISRHSVTRYRVNNNLTLTGRPADFADNAHWPVVRLKRHYRISHQTVLKWRQEIGMDIGERRMAKSPPADFAELYQTMTLAEIAKMHRVSEDTARKWRNMLGIPSKTDAMPCPNDFAQMAAQMPMVQLTQRYGVSATVISRWARENMVRIECGRRLRSPDDFQHNAKTYPVSELMKIYSVSRGVIMRWLSEAGLKPRLAVWRQTVAGINFGSGKPQFAARDATLAGMASDHLKRYFAPVCKAEYSCHKGPKGSYLVGRKLMRRDDMIELARKKGFSGDAY